MSTNSTRRDLELSLLSQYSDWLQKTTVCIPSKPSHKWRKKKAGERDDSEFDALVLVLFDPTRFTSSKVLTHPRPLFISLPDQFHSPISGTLGRESPTLLPSHRRSLLFFHSLSSLLFFSASRHPHPRLPLHRQSPSRQRRPQRLHSQLSLHPPHLPSFDKSRRNEKDDLRCCDWSDAGRLDQLGGGCEGGKRSQEGGGVGLV